MKQQERPWELLLKFRKRQGWTQVDMAKRIGISQGNYSKIEGGAMEPSITVLGFVYSQLTGKTVLGEIRERLK